MWFGWSWDSGTRTLRSPQGYTFVFDSGGYLLSKSEADGLRVTTYTYTDMGNGQKCVNSVTDSYGNTWEHGVDATKPGPSYVTDPDATKKVVFSYVPVGSDGAGQYSQVTVYKKSDGQWVEQQHTDYTYNSDHQVTIVTTTYLGDPLNPSVSTTNTSYDASKRVARVYNESLRSDVRYTYDTQSIAWESDPGQSSTYGYTQIRQCAVYDSIDDTKDRVTRNYYYQNASGKNADLFREVRMVNGASGLEAYATTEYQLYGYLDRFSTTPPTYYAVLQGKPWKVIDPRGNETTYEYSTTNGMVTKITLPTTSDYIQYSYTGSYLEKVRDERGKYTRYTRDGSYPSLVTKVEVSDYADSGYSTVQEMAYWMPGDTGYDPHKKGLPRQVTVPDIEGDDDMVTTYDYEEEIDSETYYRSNPTITSYSWWNGSSYESKPTTTSYFADGRDRWSQDALGNQTDFTYDDELRLTKTWLPADTADSGATTGSGATSITDSSKTWLSHQLKGMALVITSGAAQGVYTISDNSASEITIASGDLTNAHPGNYLVRPLHEHHYAACCGTVEWTRDERGNKTYYEYDNDQVTEIRNDVTGSDSTYALVENAYDDLGQKTEVTTYKDSGDSTGRTTSYTYDQLGRVIRVVYPDNGGTRLLWDEYYQYDVNGNVVAKLVGTLDSNTVDEGKVTAYEHDLLNRTTKVKYDYYNGVSQENRVWPLQSITISTPDESYSYYGGSGSIYQMTDSTGTSTYTYDARGRVVAYTPSTPSGYTIEYDYNSAGDKVALRLKLSGVETFRTTYSYYKNAWLKQVKGQEYVSGSYLDRAQIDFEYDAVGNLTKRKNNGSNDMETTYVSNDRGESQSITHSKTTDLYKMIYRTDGSGNPLEIAFGGDEFDKVYTDAEAVRYEYDALGRLTGEDWGHLSGGSWMSDNSTNWDYDWVDNRDPSSFAYNQVDELAAGNGYTYDMLGNLTEVSSTDAAYTYNDLNMLAEAVLDTSTATLTWARHARLARLESGELSWTNVCEPNTFYPSVLHVEKQETGQASQYVYYVRGPQGTLLASFDQDDPQHKRYYHYDDLGSAVLITDGSGTAVHAFTYGAWGDVLNTSAEGGKPYRFVSELGYYGFASNQGTALQGLMQLGFRMYDPQIGRFAQKDPVRHGANHYSYAGGRPTSSVDPRGLYEGGRGCQFCQDTMDGWLNEINVALTSPICQAALMDAGVSGCVTNNLDGLTINCDSCDGDAGMTDSITHVISINCTVAANRTMLHEAVHACRYKRGLLAQDPHFPFPGYHWCPICRREWGTKEPYPWTAEEELTERVVHSCGFLN